MLVRRGAAAACRLALAVSLLTGTLAIPAADSCPKKLDCAIDKREFCPPGSDSCGPCLPNHVEDADGKCVLKRNSRAAKPLPNLDDDSIDYLASVLQKQGEYQLHSRNQGITFAAENQLLANEPPEETLGKSRAAKPNATDQPIASAKGSPSDSHAPFSDALLLGLVIACSIAGLTALIVAGLCWCKLQREIRLAQKIDYQAQKAPGPPPYDKTSPGDKKLAQSAQMYHYQHQKQQMLSLEKHKDEPKLPDSATTSDEENEDGDFTVYECPGLAPTGEMEVKNPLFDDSSLHPNPKLQ